MANKLIFEERVDPSDFTFERFVIDNLRAGKILHTPWGTWHSLKIHEARYQFAYNLCSSTDRVLDIASGTGYGSRFFNGATYVGVDYDLTTSIFASKNNLYFSEQQSYLNGSAVNLPFADNSFDKIISLETLEHIPLDLLLNCLNEFNRVLKPGGILIASMPNRDFYHAGKTLYTKPLNPHHFFEPNMDEFIEIFNLHFDNANFYYQTGRYNYPRNRLAGKVSKLVRVARSEYLKVKPLDGYNRNIEIPGVFLTVCEANK